MHFKIRYFRIKSNCFIRRIRTKNDIIRYSAGGLRDFTRIAASDPTMWKDIFIDNSGLIIDAIDKFSESLDEFKKAIKEKNSEKLLQIFDSLLANISTIFVKICQR